MFMFFFFFSSRRRHTRLTCDWSSDVCSSDLEVSPFIGYRVGGGFKLLDTGQRVELDDHGSFALALDARADESTQYELFYGRQSTALRADALAPASIDVEYLHIGGTVSLDEEPRLKPYLAGGLGITRLSPDPALGHEDTR